MGIYYQRAVELAPSDLYFTCSGLPAFSFQSRGTSLHQRIAARAERGIAVLAAPGRHWVYMAKLYSSGTLRGSSGERGIRGVDFRAQERAQHDVFSADA